MQLINAPGKLVLPFANAGAKNTIPTASQIGIVAGAASLTDGFPPLTRTPLAAGGVPPSSRSRFTCADSTPATPCKALVTAATQ